MSSLRKPRSKLFVARHHTTNLNLMAYLLMVLLMDFPVLSYGYMLTPQIAIPVLLLATSLMKWKIRSGTPTRIRSDLGPENPSVEQMTTSFLRDTGSSNHNQRIEQWWGFLRKHHAQYWMNIFQDLKEQDHISGDFDKNRIQFTCRELIEVA